MGRRRCMRCSQEIPEQNMRRRDTGWECRLKWACEVRLVRRRAREQADAFPEVQDTPR